MCECDFNQPAFYNDKLARARKVHRCCECGMDIRPGDVYEIANGKWDGEFRVYKTCVRCLILWRTVQLETDTCRCFGMLREEIAEISNFQSSR